MAKVYNNQPIIMSSVSVKTPVDNGPIYEGKYRVRYFDTDGTILKIEYVESGGKTTPPNNPNYDTEYLIFAEWNYDTDNYIVEQPTDIGAIYDTVGDVTYMFCRFTTNTGLNPNLLISGATSIDWGDGTIDTNVSHTYANEGEYIIKIYGNISFTSSSTKYLLGGYHLNKALQKCYIKNSVTSIGNHAFYYCTSLKSITIPNSIKSIGSSAFHNCYSLANITISNSVKSIGSSAFYYCYNLANILITNSVTSIGDSAFYYCTSLKSITIPNSIKSIGNSVFSTCYNLTSITIPEGVTNIGQSAFSTCYSLKNISIPNSVKNINNYAFNYCYSLTNYFIECDTVPVLSNTNAFGDINKSAIFWVKDSIIEQLKVATNWSTYATYMKPLSWYPSLTNPNA